MSLWASFAHWSRGVRLYIAIGTLLLSAEVWWWASTTYAGDTELITSRLHEAFGWLALLVLAFTLAIGPTYKLAPQLPGKVILRDARRLLGISAAWFATLHVGIAYIVSFQAVNPLQLAGNYQRAFAIGAIALLILLAMAFTSFDAAFKGMGIWWFRLHRLVYAAAALAVWHAFMIGVHATSVIALAILIGVALLLLISHVHIALQRQGRPSTWQIITLCGILAVLIGLGNYGIQQYINQQTAFSRHQH